MAHVRESTRMPRSTQTPASTLMAPNMPAAPEFSDLRFVISCRGFKV